MAIQILHRTVIVTVKVNRAVVAGENDNGVFRETDAVERPHDLPDLPVNLLDDIAAHAAVARADKRFLGHSGNVRIKQANFEEKWLVLPLLDELDGLGDNRAGEFLVFETGRLAAFHVADAADAVDDRAGVLFVRALLEQFGAFQASRFVAKVRDVAHLNRVTLLLGLVGYYGAVKSNASIGELGKVRLPSVESLLTISEAQTAVDGAENALLSRDIKLQARKEKYTTFADAWKRAEAAWKVYEPLPQNTEEEATWKKFVPAWEAWKKDHQAYVALSQEYDKTVMDQEKGSELYSKMASQALAINAESFAKAKIVLDQIVELYRAKSDNAQATYSKVDLLTVHSMLTLKEAQTGIDSAENALLDRSGDLADRKTSYDRITAAWQRIAAARKVYELLEQTPEEARLWQAFVPAWEKWKTDHEAFVALSKSYDGTVDGYRRSNELYKKMTEQGLVVNAVTFGAAETYG